MNPPRSAGEATTPPACQGWSGGRGGGKLWAKRVTVRIMKGNTNPQGPGADDGSFSQRGGTEPAIAAGASLADEDEPAAVVALAQQRRSARERSPPRPPRGRTSFSALGGRAGEGSQGVEDRGVGMTESGLLVKEPAGGLARRSSGMCSARRERLPHEEVSPRFVRPG